MIKDLRTRVKNPAHLVRLWFYQSPDPACHAKPEPTHRGAGNFYIMARERCHFPQITLYFIK